MLSGLLTSCGESKEIASLRIDCERVLKNLQAIYDPPELFENSDFADDDSVALLFGAESRREIERKILEEFPFLDDIIVGKPRDKQQIDLYYYAGSIYLISQALIGTKISFPYSQAEMRSIATQDDGFNKVVRPLAQQIFGDSDDENPQGCGLVEKDRENVVETGDETNTTNNAFNWASEVYLDFAGMLQGIRNCEVSGWNVTNKCAKVDYVEKDYDWGPPTPTDPFIKRWSDPVQEGLAKFAWCWNQNKSYDNSSDSCL